MKLTSIYFLSILFIFLQAQFIYAATFWENTEQNDKYRDLDQPQRIYISDHDINQPLELPLAIAIPKEIKTDSLPPLLDNLEMRISTDPNFLDTSWEPFTTTKIMTLTPPVADTIPVYAEFRNTIKYPNQLLSSYNLQLIINAASPTITYTTISPVNNMTQLKIEGIIDGPFSSLTINNIPIPTTITDQGEQIFSITLPQVTDSVTVSTTTIDGTIFLDQPQIGATMEDGVLSLNGKPLFMWTAEYPYYRDKKDDWSRQLDNLKQMNVNIVTFYIPWRHHEYHDNTFDFNGSRDNGLGNTDVLQFINLIKQKGMYCIVKPGPYINGETVNGGLPDYVMPQNNPAIECRKKFDGSPTGHPHIPNESGAPAPMDQDYYAIYVNDWLEHVASDVIVDNMYPRGPIVAVQLLNEGIYCMGPANINDINYEDSAVDTYKKYMQDTSLYNDIATYNNYHDTNYTDFSDLPPVKILNTPKPTNKAQMLKYIDWAHFGAYFHQEVVRTYSNYLTGNGVTLPILMNLNPSFGHDDSSTRKYFETTAGRINPIELSQQINYGYTGWAGGVVAYTDHCYLKYRFMAKAGRGPSLEQSWGYDDYLDDNYTYVQPSYFESMTYLLWGTTGINLYTGISCDEWDLDLAIFPEGKQYMQSNPISADGYFRKTALTAYQMSVFLEAEGPYLLENTPTPTIYWGLYRPYAWADSWNEGGSDMILTNDDWKNAGFQSRPYAAFNGWDCFMDFCSATNIDNSVVYLREEDLDPQKHKIIFFAGSDWMDERTQQKITEYVSNGGIFVMTSYIPELNELFENCTILKNALFNTPIAETKTLPITSLKEAIGNIDINFTGKDTDQTISIGNNLSLNKNAYASNSDEIADYAIDGSIEGGSRWYSEAEDDAYLYIDLEKETSVQTVRIIWEAAYATKYEIQISNDATTWQTVLTLDDLDGDVDVLTLPEDTHARYIKMQGVERKYGGECGYSIWEMELYDHKLNIDDDFILRTYQLPENYTSLATVSINGISLPQPIAYEQIYGQGKAIFLGFHPWYNWQQTSQLVNYILTNYTTISDINSTSVINGDQLVDTQEYKNTDHAIQYVFLSARKNIPDTYQINFTDEYDDTQSFTIDLPSYSAAVVGFQEGSIRSAILKGTNDHEHIFVTPRLTFQDLELSASHPCDIELSKKNNTYHLSVTNIILSPSTLITLPITTSQILKIEQINSNNQRTEIPFTDIDSNTQFTAYDSTSNLAYNRCVTVSSKQDDDLSADGENAVDGNEWYTRWSSDFTDDQWLYVDLGEKMPFSSIRLKWQEAYAKKYRIQTADTNPDDPTQWQDVYLEDNGTADKLVDTFIEYYLGSQEARYIKIKGEERGTPWGYSIWELEIYDKDTQESKPNHILGYDIILKD